MTFAASTIAGAAASDAVVSAADPPLLHTSRCRRRSKSNSGEAGASDPASARALCLKPEYASSSGQKLRTLLVEELQFFGPAICFNLPELGVLLRTEFYLQLSSRVLLFGDDNNSA